MRPPFYALNNNVNYASYYLREMGNPYLKSTSIYDIDFLVGYKIMQLDVNYQYYKDYLSMTFLTDEYHELLFSANFIYNTKGSSYGMEYNSYGLLDLGLRKTFFNNSLNVSLNISDPFNWYIINDQTYYNYVYRKRKSSFDTRNVSVTLKWNFNNYKNNYRGSSSIEEERSRL